MYYVLCCRIMTPAQWSSPCLCLISQIKKSNPRKLKTKLDSDPHNNKYFKQKHPADYLHWAGFSFIRKLLSSIRQSISCFKRSNGWIIPNGWDGIQIFCTVKWSPLCCPWVCLVVSIVLEMVSSPAWLVVPGWELTPLRPQSDFCWWFFPALVIVTLSHISQMIQTITELDTELVS